MTDASAPAPWLGPDIHGFDRLNGKVVGAVLGGRDRAWWIAFAVSLLCTLVMAAGVGWSFLIGPGAWGNDAAVVWGFPIANFVWWVGVGHAGTLISSMLLLTRQRWRASINRFAEGMTLFAICIAGFMPILHLGRPMYFLWIAPLPNIMDLWPQWRSALVWDFSAIFSYLVFSILFFYVGLLPDVATVRDRARSRIAKRVYGVLALGWRGSLQQWSLQRRCHRLLAKLAIPLVVSVHSIVGLDFAAGITPGWHESLFPPYFVVGALFSGFAMVVILAAWLRPALHLEQVITENHFEALARVILAASLFMGLAYATEVFVAWYGSAPSDKRALHYQIFGLYGPVYWPMLTCNVFAPQVLWSPRLRRSKPVLVGVALAVLTGMYLERILIVMTGLSRAYEPSLWRVFVPTITDFAILFGSLGLFAMLMLVFSRLVPVVSMHEMRDLLVTENRA